MSWLLGSWGRLLPWVVGSLALVAVWFYGHYQEARIAALQQKLVAAEANGAVAENLARNNAAAVQDAERQHAADELAIKDHFNRQAEAEKATVAILESVDHASPEDDGPVAPVLLRAFDCLREQAGDAVGARAAFCEGGAAGGASDVPKSAPGAGAR